MVLYTAGYRDPLDQRRLPPEVFYGSLPEDAVVVDIRSHPYSPFAPWYTGSGVPAAVREFKPGRTDFYAVGALGNTHRNAEGKRVNPPLLRDPEKGFEILDSILATHEQAVIFCACSLATLNDSLYRCHRFFVAEEMLHRHPDLCVVHLPETGTY